MEYSNKSKFKKWGKKNILNEKTFRDRGSGFMIDKAKKIIRKKAIANVNEKIAYLQKKPSDYTKDELRDLIVNEEKKILQGWGLKGAATTILAMFGIANI